MSTCNISDMDRNDGTKIRVSESNEVRREGHKKCRETDWNVVDALKRINASEHNPMNAFHTQPTGNRTQGRQRIQRQARHGEETEVEYLKAQRNVDVKVVIKTQGLSSELKTDVNKEDGHGLRSTKHAVAASFLPVIILAQRLVSGDWRSFDSFTQSEMTWLCRRARCVADTNINADNNH